MKRAHVLRNWLAVLTFSTVSLFASAQKHEEGGHASAPHESAPHQSAPHQSAPHQSAPRESAPRQSAPRQSAPRSSAPSRPSNQGRNMGNGGQHQNSSRPGGNSNTRPAGNPAAGSHNVPRPPSSGGIHRESNARPGGNAGGARNTFHAPAGATQTANRRGGTTYTTKNGAHFSTGRNGNLRSYSHGDTRATFGRGGHITSIHTNGMVINRGGRGGRTVISTRAGGVRVVGFGRGRGFVEHPFSRGGRDFYRRSYFYGGHSYARVYGRYGWGGGFFGFYIHPFFFAPAFYGWGYNPWFSPIPWGWGWGGSPWYGYYGGYFSPLAVYPSPAWWLTDWYIGSELQSSYQARVDADAAAAQADGDQPQPAAQNQAPLTPEVRQAIADEVTAQLQAQQAQAANPQQASAAPTTAPGALDPKNRVFVVFTDLAEQTADGQNCALSGGDVITRLTDTPDSNQNVNVSVLSAKSGDCAAGSQVSVGVQDLQDMHNHFLEQLDTGLGELKKNQGKNGMPAAPAAANADPTPVPDGDAQPDADAQSDLQQQQQQADQTEQQVTKEATASDQGTYTNQ